MRIVMLISLLLVASGCSRTPVTPSLNPESKPSEVARVATHKAKLEEVKKKASQVSVGMTRSEVELLFREKDGGVQGPSVSRYYEHPEVMIEIPFDQTGGNWNKDNRVTGEPKIYRSLEHYD